MRICMVIMSYFPVVGGAEKQLGQLAKLMVSEGHVVRVVTRRYPGLKEREEIDGVEVCRVSSGGMGKFSSLSFLICATRCINQFKPDVIHCHSAFSPSLAGLVAARMRPVPLFVKPMCGGEVSSIAKKPFGGLRLRWMLRTVDRMIAVSSEIKNELLAHRFEAGKILHIPNGVDAELYKPATSEDEQQEIRAKYGLPSGTLLLFAGRIARQKRLPLLLEVWPEVREAFPDATLCIAGANRKTESGSKYEADVKDKDDVPDHLLRQDGVQLLGHIDQMNELLKAVDVFVLPSSIEGLSNAMLEACASATIFVGARIGGNTDLITNGEDGLIFEPDSAISLADVLAQAITLSSTRVKLGPAARQRVLDKFDIRVTASRLLATYSELNATKISGSAIRSASKIGKA